MSSASMVSVTSVPEVVVAGMVMVRVPLACVLLPLLILQSQTHTNRVDLLKAL